MAEGAAVAVGAAAADVEEEAVAEAVAHHPHHREYFCCIFGVFFGTASSGSIVFKALKLRHFNGN